MGGDEEDLKKRLLALEKGVFDPALVGRGEEIWARMVGVRQRARLLQEEMERSGALKASKEYSSGENGAAMDEEVMKKAEKVLLTCQTSILQPLLIGP
jgi:nuclear pore complex protein Nup54